MGPAGIIGLPGPNGLKVHHTRAHITTSCICQSPAVIACVCFCVCLLQGVSGNMGEPGLKGDKVI